jgi:hypothetical protein
VGWVAGMLALTVLYFGWGYLAGDYFQNEAANGPVETNFWINTVAQLPNFFSVMGYSFRNRLWVFGVILILELGVLILWGVMKKLDRELWSK